MPLYIVMGILAALCVIACGICCFGSRDSVRTQAEEVKMGTHILNMIVTLHIVTLHIGGRNGWLQTGLHQLLYLRLSQSLTQLQRACGRVTKTV